MTRSLASDVLADCHFSTKPAGKFLWLSWLLIQRLMALYWRLLSSNGISAGSVICMIASFCSGLKHFTRLTFSSSVLMVPQFQKKISRQLEKGSMTSILTLPRITMPLIETVLGALLGAERGVVSAGLTAVRNNKCTYVFEIWYIQWRRASKRRLFLRVFLK